MRHIIVVVIGLMLGAAAHAQPRSQDTDLQSAIRTETVVGDLKAAIAQYQAIVDKYAKTDRATAATALLRMAECHQKLGEEQATKLFTRIVQEYGDQPAAATASARLGKPARIALAERPVSVCNGAVLSEGIPSPDLLSVAIIRAGDLVLRDVRSCAERVLVPHESRGGADGTVVWASFSRDGKRVAYNWRINENGALADELRIVNTSGPAAPRVLLRDANTDGYSIKPGDWSSDGGSLAVVIGHLADGVRQLALVDVAKGTSRVLKSLEWRSTTRAALSPDGRYVAYDLPAGANTTARDVFIIAADGSHETVVASSPAHDQVIGWSADGRRLFFLSDRDSVPGIYVQSIVAGWPRGTPVSARSGVANGAVTLIGNDAFVTRVQVGGSSVKTAAIDLATGRVGEMTAAPAQPGGTYYPDFSPDGKWLSYVSDAPDGTPRLTLQSLQTSQVRTMTINLAAVLAYRWSPDSRIIYLQAADFRNRIGIFRFDAGSGEVTAVVVPSDVKTRNVAPLPSADGSKLYYFTRGGERVVGGETTLFTGYIERDLRSGSERPLMRTGEYGWGNISPDATFVGMAGENQSSLWIVNVASGERRRVLSVTAPEAIWGGPVVEWTPDGRAVFIRKSSNATPESPAELWLIRADGERSHRIDLGPGYSGAGVRVSADGRRIAFTTGTGPRHELRVVEAIGVSR